MWIRSIRLREAPGVAELYLDAFGPGVNVILGPNASGKSTLARTLRALFSPAPAELGEGWAHAELEEGSRRFPVKRAPGAAAAWPEGRDLPPGGHEPELYELDLGRLAALGESEDRAGGLAAGFARELFGGIDLEAARQQYPVKSATARSNLVSERHDAGLALEKALREARSLAAEAEGLDALRREREAAETALADAELTGRLCELLELRQALAALQTERDALDPALERIEAEAPALLEDLEDELARATRQVETLEARQAQLGTELERLGVPTTGERPTATLLAEAKARRELCHELHEASRALEDARADLVAAHAGEAEAGKRFFAPPQSVGLEEPPRPIDPRLTDADAEELDRALAKLAEARAERRAAEAWAVRAEGRLGEVQTRARELGLPEDPERLRQGLTALHGWLSVTPERHRRLFALFGAGLFLAGAGLGVLIHALVFWSLRAPHLVAAALGLAGLGLAGWAWSRRVSADRGGPERTVREADAGKAGVVPEAWTREAVGERLAQGWEVLARVEAIDGLLAGPDAIVRQSRDALDEAGARALALGERFGLSPELPTLSAQERAHRLIDLIRAQASAELAAAAVARNEETVADHRQALGTFLGDLGLSSPEHASELRSLVDDLIERLGKQVELEATRDRTEADLEQARADRELRHRKLEEAFAGWGLKKEERGRLAELASARPRLDDLRGRLEALGRDEARLVAGLDPEEVEARLGLSRDEVELGAARELLARLAQHGERSRSLADAVVRIETRIDAAGSARALVGARARRDEARLALDRERDRQLHHLLVHTCLDDAVGTFQTDHQPARLRRASELFFEFTRHQWRLVLDPAAGGGFRAEDLARGETRRLSQLSEGTRVHLLLAARLATIEAHEQGGPMLPLCLDELLSTTDPARFDEIARVLLDLAGRGRQIFYFSSSEAEAAQWPAAAARLDPEGEGPAVRVHHLLEGRIRGDFTDDDALKAGAPRPIPAPPASGDAALYARQLRVAPIDGHRPASAWHLLHLLFDRLEALHLLLEHGVETLGHWRAAQEAGATGPVDSEVTALLELRGALLEETLRAWCIGRGRPPTWTEVVESGAVSPTFEDRVRTLLEANRDDAGAFLAALEGDLKGFRRQKLEELREHLTEVGALGDGALLDRGAILARAVTVAAPRLGASDASAARAFVAHLLTLLSPDEAGPRQLSLSVLEGGGDG